MDVELDRKLLKWGSGYGLRLTAKEVEALGIRPGDLVHAKVGLAPIQNDFSSLAKYDFPPWPPGFDFDDPDALDDLIDEDLMEDMKRKLEDDSDGPL